MLPCLILAGGIGSRIRPLTDTIPKALVPVAGRPFIDLQLGWLASQGVSDVVLSVGYRGALLREHVGDGAQHRISVSYVDEGERRLGTGGAVRLAVDRGAVGEAFFILYGDSYLDVDVAATEASWRASGRPALMTVLRNDGRWGRSNAAYSAGVVTAYDKVAPDPSFRYIDYGLLVMTAAEITRRIPPDTVIDLAEPLRALSQDGQLAGLQVSRRFHEVGSPQGVRELERHLGRRRTAVRASAHGRPALGA